MLRILSIILLFFLVSILCLSGQTPDSTKIEDGFYIVLNEFDKKESITGSKGLVVPYSKVFLEGNLEEQPSFFEIDTTTFVPLWLAEKPDSVRQKDQRIHLMLSLTPSAARDLETFTGNNIMKQVAIVVGGRAMTKHKIREKIIGGKMQVTRCTDNACEFLFYELQDNVSTPSGN